MVMDVLAIEKSSGSIRVDLPDALSCNRSCPGGGRPCDVQQVTGSRQNLLVSVKASCDDVASKRPSILRRWPPKIDIRVRYGVLVIVEAGPQQMDQLVPKRDHGLFGSVLEALRCPGGEGTDDKGRSVELAWIHSSPRSSGVPVQIPLSVSSAAGHERSHDEDPSQSDEWDCCHAGSGGRTSTFSVAHAGRSLIATSSQSSIGLRGHGGDRSVPLSRRRRRFLLRCRTRLAPRGLAFLV